MQDKISKKRDWRDSIAFIAFGVMIVMTFLAVSAFQPAPFLILGAIPCFFVVICCRGKNRWIAMAIIVAVSIVAVLTTRYGTNHRSKAILIHCNSTLKQIGMQLLLYAEENNGYFPVNYNNNELFCKERKNIQESGYIYLGKDKKITDDKFIIMHDKKDNHIEEKKYNVLYSTGEVVSENI